MRAGQSRRVIRSKKIQVRVNNDLFSWIESEAVRKGCSVSDAATEMLVESRVHREYVEMSRLESALTEILDHVRKATHD